MIAPIISGAVSRNYIGRGLGNAKAHIASTPFSDRNIYSAGYARSVSRRHGGHGRRGAKDVVRVVNDELQDLSQLIEMKARAQANEIACLRDEMQQTRSELAVAWLKLIVERGETTASLTDKLVETVSS